MVTTDLIAQYIEENPHRPGPGDAIIRGVGVSVWIVVEAYRASGRDSERIARAWDIPREAMDAALAYYAKHTAAIDARIESQRAPFI